MITAARILAVTGMIMMILGTLPPVFCHENLECEIGKLGSFMPLEDSDFFDDEEDDNEAEVNDLLEYMIFHFGFFIIGISLTILIPVITGKKAAFWMAALINGGVVTGLYIGFSLLKDRFLAGEFSLAWGWGVFFAAAIVIIVAAMFATVAPRPSEQPAMPGPYYPPQSPGPG